MEAFRLQFESLNLALRFDSQESSIRFVGDPDRIAQILANLVENAMKFARSEVVIALSLTTLGALVGVSDDGPVSR